MMLEEIVPEVLSWFHDEILMSISGSCASQAIPKFEMGSLGARSRRWSGDL
jgi:hypothetical protein